MLILFVVLLLLATIFGLWLEARQSAFVARHRDQVPVAFSARVSLADHHKACDYTLAKSRVAMVSEVVGTGLTLLLGYAGGIAFLYAAIIPLAGTGYLGTLLLLATIGLIFGLVELPLDLYRTFNIEERFGFNKMTMKIFIVDKIKALALMAVIGSALIFVIDFAMRRSGGYWWLWAWAIWAVFNIIAIFAMKFVAPLFNKYEPLETGTLRDRLEAILSKCGFKSNGVFKVDGSKRSTHANAYFTGFGAVKRIVLYDTLIDKLDADEIEAVIAHELGHFRHGHIRKRFVFLFLTSFVLLAILGWLAQQDWFFALFQMQRADFQATPMIALVLFMMLSASFSGWFGVIFNHFSRKDEFEADAFAARNSEKAKLASALVKLQRDNAMTLTPDPIYSAVHHSHPTVAQRIDRLAALPA